MNRRTAIRVVVMTMFGIMGGAHVSYGQEPTKPSGLPPEPLEIGPKDSPLVSAAGFVEYKPQKDMYLEYANTLETVIVRYKGQEKKISVWQLFDAL